MIPKTSDVLGLLERLAPTSLAEPWDNPGLQVGSYSQEVTKILMALDPTLEALHHAAHQHAQLLFTHHPLIFKPLNTIDAGAYPGEVLAEALKCEISIVAAHTNLDAAVGGINDILAELLGLQDTGVLQEADGFDGAGLGRIGNLPEPRMLLSLTEDLKQVFGVERFRMVAQGDTKIRRVAVVGGSGGGLVLNAAEKGADLLITGDVGHHHALEAVSLGIAVIDAGHYNTEKTAFHEFGKRLKPMVLEMEWDVEVELNTNECNPLMHGV